MLERASVVTESMLKYFKGEYDKCLCGRESVARYFLVWESVVFRVWGSVAGQEEEAWWVAVHYRWALMVLAHAAHVSKRGNEAR